MRIVTNFVNEGGTAVVTLSFANELGTAIVPKTASWRLLDSHGNVVNNRNGVNIVSLSESVKVVLTGNDLATFGAHDNLRRYLIVSGTYDSPEQDDASFVDELIFGINDVGQHR